MGRLNQRQGFLFSAIAHLAILMALASRAPAPTPPEAVPRASPPPPRAALILPDRELLREYLRPQPAVPKAVPAPTPPPPAADRKDRISIGPPSDVRQKQLILRRDEDLVMPKGTPSATPNATPSLEPPDSAVAPNAARPTPRLREPVIDGQGSPVLEAPQAPSIAGSLRNLERRLHDGGPRGLPTGTGQQMGALFFDPEGADFTAWMNHFKNEVYRNWIVPQPALMGFRGHVDIEFVVERDGRISSLRIVKSTGTPALDRAAQNALLGSRLLPLPADFGSPRITMQGGFYYNQGPQGS